MDVENRRDVEDCLGGAHDHYHHRYHHHHQVQSSLTNYHQDIQSFARSHQIAFLSDNLK